MAGNQNSGGMRPTAPQNNPMNVKGNGGNGQSGQAAQRYTGMPYGQGQALMQQQAAAPMAKGSMSSPSGLGLLPVPQLTDPTQNPGQDISFGADAGPGPGTEALQIPSNIAPDNTQSNQALDAYYPVMSFINSRPSTSPETRKVLSLLMRGRTVL
jgi:hypothetical protein